MRKVFHKSLLLLVFMGSCLYTLILCENKINDGIRNKELINRQYSLIAAIECLENSQIGEVKISTYIDSRMKFEPELFTDELYNTIKYRDVKSIDQMYKKLSEDIMSIDEEIEKLSIIRYCIIVSTCATVIILLRQACLSKEVCSGERENEEVQSIL